MEPYSTLRPVFDNASDYRSGGRQAPFGASFDFYELWAVKPGNHKQVNEPHVNISNLRANTINHFIIR